MSNIDHMETHYADPVDRADHETTLATETKITEIRAQAQKLEVQPILKEERDDNGNIVHAYSICLHCAEQIPYGERWCRADPKFSRARDTCRDTWEDDEKERRMRSLRD